MRRMDSSKGSKGNRMMTGMVGMVLSSDLVRR